MSESIKQQSCCISGQPMLVILLLLLQAGRIIFSYSLPANLTATNAYPVLGGYVVPVNGSITLHCEAQGPPFTNTTKLQWNLAVGIYSKNGKSAAVIALEYMNKFTYVQPDVENPAVLRIHNLQISENRSTVQCSVTNHADTGSEDIIIYVEDIPNCVENLNTSSTGMVSWNRYNGLLPVMYNISIWSTSSEVVVLESTEHTMFHLDSNVYNLQSNTTYFVLVNTCNSAGCSQDCGNITLYTGPGVLHVTVHDKLPTKVCQNCTSLSVWTLIIIVVPVAVALFTIILMVVVLLFCYIGSCRMSKTRDVIQQSAARHNDHEHMSEREVQESDDVSHTSMDVTGVVMEENPAYGTVPIRMGETDMAELPPLLPLWPQDTVNLVMQENPSYSPLQTNSGVHVTVTK